MKVYIIATDFDYEGYSEPEEAFTTREAAQRKADQENEEKHSWVARVFELEVQE